MCGWDSQSRISNYEKNRREPSSADLKRIASKLGKRVYWFYMEDEDEQPDPFHLSDGNDQDYGVREEVPAGYQSLQAGPTIGPRTEVPLVGTTQAGPDRQWLEEGYPVGYGDQYLDVPAKDPCAYALRVRGASMDPAIKEGKVLLVYPLQEPIPDDDVVVATTDGDVMVKKLAYQRAGEVALDSINNGYPRIVLNVDEIEYIHVVIGVMNASAIRQR